MDNQAIARGWLAKAADDVRWCQSSIAGGVWHGACFSAQQAAEKALKAYLMLHNGNIRKIHDLGALLEQCIATDASFESIREHVLPLVDYYLQTRYPDMGDFIDYTEEKAHHALSSARTIIEFVSPRVS